MAVDHVIWLIVTLALISLLAVVGRFPAISMMGVQIGYAIRGALIGLVVCDTVYATWKCANWITIRNPRIDDVGTAELITLVLGAPASFLSGRLAARAAGLSRTVAISLVGLLNAPLSIFLLGSLGIFGLEPQWLIAVGLVVFAYVAAVYMVAPSMRIGNSAVTKAAGTHRDLALWVPAKAIFLAKN